jgi:hypothetical protein
MTRNRPASVLVIAILNIILGSLGFLCSLCMGGTSLAAPLMLKLEAKGPQAGKTMAGDPLLQARLMEKEIPHGFLIMGINYSVFLVLSALLLAGGIGLVGMRHWARTLTILVALLTIIAHAAHLVYMFLVLMPAQKRVNAEVMEQIKTQPQGQQIAEITKQFEGLGEAVPVVITAAIIIYSIVVIAVLVSGGVKAAFACGSAPSSGSEDYYDPRA